MRIGVTGADGFTGRYLMPALADRGHEPVSLNADLTDVGAVAEEVAKTRPEAVVHLAGRAFVYSADYAAFYAVNQLGSFHLLAALAEYVPGISVLIASSAQVYGKQAVGLVGEQTSMNPSNHYAASKAAMELGCHIWSDQLRITVVRPFNYTGIGQETRYLVPKLVQAFSCRLPTIALGRTDVQRDFGDVRAVVEAYCDLVEQTPCGVLNIGTGVVTSVAAVIDLLAAITGHRIDIHTDQALVRKIDVPVLGCDNRMLRRILPAWEPRPLRDTLTWMLAGQMKTLS